MYLSVRSLDTLQVNFIHGGDVASAMEKICNSLPFKSMTKYVLLSSHLLFLSIPLFLTYIARRKKKGGTIVFSSSQELQQALREIRQKSHSLYIEVDVVHYDMPGYIFLFFLMISNTEMDGQGRKKER